MASTGTDGESSEELEEGFFTADQDEKMAENLSDSKPLNIDISSMGATSNKLQALDKNRQHRPAAGNRSTYTDVQDVINVVT